MSFFDELKRRKVIRVGIAYLAVAWLLLQVAETLLPTYGYTDAAIRTLVAVLAVGFVIVLVLAWIFDWTPAGVEVTAAAGEQKTYTATRAPNMVIAFFVLVAAAAAAWLTWKSLEGVPRTERTIAVLPFATLGQDQADVFTDGMHLGVLTRLSAVHELDVISRTSVMRFRDHTASLPEIAEQLGADWVLNAEVQQGNEEVLVSVALVDARKDRQVWAENYRRTLTATNLFQIQAEIARRIIDQIRVQLTEQEADRLALVPTRDLDAYRLYQLGRMKLEARSRDDMWAAVDLFAEALEYDPDYALAHAGTADALISLVAYGHENGADILARAAAEVERALQLDSGLAEAWAASAQLAYQFRDLPRAISDAERAIEARPSFSRAYTINAYNYSLAGDREAALASSRRAVALDPLSPEAVVNLAASSMEAGRQETALSEARRALEMAPGWPNTRFVHGLMLFEMGRYREAAVELRDLSIPWVGMGVETILALSLHALGQEAEAEALFQAVAASDDAYALATLTAAFRDLDEGYRLLAKLELWADWPTLAFTYHHAHIWNPDGNDPRYEATRRHIDETWGLD